MPSCIRCSCPLFWAALAAISCLAIWEVKEIHSLAWPSGSKAIGTPEEARGFKRDQLLMGYKFTCAIQTVQKALTQAVMIDLAQAIAMRGPLLKKHDL